jgi:transposase-like protein
LLKSPAAGGEWRYVYRAMDQFGQVVNGFVSRQRDAAAAHRLSSGAIGSSATTAG